jgi:hypothetical protein
MIYLKHLIKIVSEGSFLVILFLYVNIVPVGIRAYMVLFHDPANNMFTIADNTGEGDIILK